MVSVCRCQFVFKLSVNSIQGVAHNLPSAPWAATLGCCWCVCGVCVCACAVCCCCACLALSAAASRWRASAGRPTATRTAATASRTAIVDQRRRRPAVGVIAIMLLCSSVSLCGLCWVCSVLLPVELFDQIPDVWPVTNRWFVKLPLSAAAVVAVATANLHSIPYNVCAMSGVVVRFVVGDYAAMYKEKMSRERHKFRVREAAALHTAAWLECTLHVVCEHNTAKKKKIRIPADPSQWPVALPSEPLETTTPPRPVALMYHGNI